MANPNEDRARDIAARGGQEQYEFDKFKAMTGRSDTNPYGDAGMFGSRADYSRTMSPRQIDQINRMAFEQARGLTSGEGYQGRGMDSPQPGYAPALKIGENIPGGTVQRATPRGTGLGSFFKDGGFLGAFLSDIGGREPRKFVPLGSDGDALDAVNYGSVPNPAAVRAARPAPRPYNAAEMLQNNMPIANPVIETGGSFGVAPMEAIANPGGQAYEGPVADMVDMTLPTPRPTNVAELLDLRDRAQRTTAAVDNAIANVGQALDRDYSPGLAAETRENVMDAILADQVRDRNFRTVENLVGRAAADSQIRQAAADSLANQEAMAREARRMQEINNPPGDPLIELPPGTGSVDDFDMLTLGTTSLPTTAPSVVDDVADMTQRMLVPLKDLIGNKDVVDYDTMPYFESSRSPFADPIAAAARSNPNATEYRTAPAIPPASPLYETNFGIMSAEDIANMTPMERSQLSFIDDVQVVADEILAGRRGLPTIR